MFLGLRNHHSAKGYVSLSKTATEGGVSIGVPAAFQKLPGKQGLQLWSSLTETVLQMNLLLISYASIIKKFHVFVSTT